MRRLLFAWVCAALAGPGFAAEDRPPFGFGYLITNDVFSNDPQRDRWRTGSGVFSFTFGPAWTGALPARLGELVEVRLRGGLITPENIVGVNRLDRPYAETLALGAHTHFRKAGVEFSLGLDLVATGPQTGMETLQGAIHDALGIPGASARVLRSRVPNGLYPTLTVEAGRSFALSPKVSVRPFVELQGGVETLARVGGDLHFGRVAQDALLLRDVTTGLRYPGIRGAATGWAATVGADIAYVADSALLPETRTVVLSDTRTRIRAGLHWRGEKASVFYGMTWLSEEFTAQREPQTVGSIQIDLHF
ncbi:MAG: DUF2219 family protein [Rhodobacter sp.]|nr:DUF2219 family protein [Rhodobacter sp.]